jgi:hypothetical protein
VNFAATTSEVVPCTKLWVFRSFEGAFFAGRALGHYYMPTGHYYLGLLQFCLLLLKNHSLFSQNRYAHEQAAILRGTFSSILSGEGFDGSGTRRVAVSTLCNRFIMCSLPVLRRADACVAGFKARSAISIQPNPVGLAANGYRAPQAPLR